MITESIIKEAQAGSSEAFAIIYNETVRTAYYVAKRILLDEDATEDVLQESYIAVFEHLSDYKTGNIQGWIDTIVANRAKNYLRRKNPIFFSEMETEENPVVEFEEDKIEFRPDEKVDYSETQRLILEIVDNLSPEQRLSVMLFYFEEKSVKEIAEICECSENTVKSRLNYARKKIKEDVLELEKKGTKLYSVSIIPFIIWMLSEKAKASSVPHGMEAKIFAGVNGMVNASSGAGMNTTVNSVVDVATKSVSSKVGIGLGAKIGIAVATVATIAGVGIGIAMLSGSGDGLGDKGNTLVGDGTGDASAELLAGANYIGEVCDDGSQIFISGYGTIKLEDCVIGDISKGYYLYSVEGAYGLKHLDGRTIIEAGTYEELKWIDSYSIYDKSDKTIHNILMVKENNQYGVINAEGEFIIPLEYDVIECVEGTHLNGTSYYRFVANKSSDSGELISTAFDEDGTKLFELMGEEIDSSNLGGGNRWYLKKNENGSPIALISVKTGEILFDCEKEGINNIFMLGRQADILYKDGSKKYVAFNKDFTSYVYTSDELTNDFSVVITSEFYGLYKYFRDELDLYANDQLVKSIKGVEDVWVINDKIYYIAENYVNDQYIRGLYDSDGIIFSSENYEWYYRETFTERYIVVKNKNETSYQLYDLVNKEAIVTGIVEPNGEECGSYGLNLDLENGKRVHVHGRQCEEDEEQVLIFDGDLYFSKKIDNYIIYGYRGKDSYVIKNLEGDVLFEYDRETYDEDYVHKLLIYHTPEKRAYYNFEGELVYEFEK